MKARYGDFDRSKSLQELEEDDWGEQPPPDQRWSTVINNAYRLRRVPLQDFTVEDIRFLLGQNIGLEYVMPMAIEHLMEDPWKPRKSYFPGELLGFALFDKFVAKRKLWERRPDLWLDMESVIQQAFVQLPQLSEREQASVYTKSPFDQSILELLRAASGSSEER